MWNAGLRARFFAEQDLVENAVFTKLPHDAQQCIRDGWQATRKKLLPPRSTPFGWTTDESEAIYKFLSNFAHSTTWSERGASVRATDNLGARSALLIGLHLGAWTVSKYCRRRSKLAKRLTVAQRHVLKTLNERETLKELFQAWEPKSSGLGVLEDA